MKVVTPFVPTKWHMHCDVLEDWEALAARFKRSRLTCERLLYKAIIADFLPDLPDIYEQQVSDAALVV